jgi:hypothetical protein
MLKYFTTAAFVAVAYASFSTASFAQTASSPPDAAGSVAATMSPSMAGPVHLAEGTEVVLRFNDRLSSETASQGDHFSVTLDEPIKLADGTVIAAGYRGVGEVTAALHKRMMGKAGQLNVRLDYLSIGDTRVPLRASSEEKGKSSVGTTVALAVLFGPLGLIKHGHDVEIEPGRKITAFVNEPTDISPPVVPPPVS